MSIASLHHSFGPIAAAAIILCLGGRPAPAAGPAADPSVGPGISEPAQDATPPASPVRIYRASCLKCHDSDGKGEIVRDVMPKVPDFTDAAWQSSRSDAELGRSILEGKGKSMPSMRNKIVPIDVRQMVAFVRAFRDGKQAVEDVEEPSTPEPAATAHPAGPARTDAGATLPAARASGPGGGSRIFQRSCAACHGTGGRGEGMRDSLPNIPDFTTGAWQASRTDPQLLVSVIDGKGTGMPPFRDKLSREQARTLVDFIRSLDPSPRPAAQPVSDDFEARFQQLLAEFEDLRRRSRALSSGASPTPGIAPGTPKEPRMSRPGRGAHQSSGDGAAEGGG